VVFRPDPHSSINIRSDDEIFLSKLPFVSRSLNCSKLHPFGCLGNTSRRLLVFDKKKDFLSKHRYGKTAASVRTTWLFRLGAILDKERRAEELQPSRRQSTLSECSVLIMTIACNRSQTVRTLGQHRPVVALFRKEFQRIWKVGCTVVRPNALSYRPDAA
jgi:hypothetical protein